METNELRRNTTQVMGPQLGTLQGRAVIAAVIGLVLAVAGLLIVADKRVLFQSYLFAYIFWVMVSTGALGLLLLHHTVGGGWGFVIRRFLEAASHPTMLLALAVGFVPIAATVFMGPYDAAGHPWLYEWVTPKPDDAVLRQKSGYLNPVFFIARTVLYFAIWIILSTLARKWGDLQYEREAPPENYHRLNYLGGFGIVIFVLTTTFMSVDWVMSLTPHWFSSIMGLLFTVDQGLSAMAMLLVLLAFLVGDAPILRGNRFDGFFRDLGNLTLAMVMLWAYMSFSQYLIQYSGNTQEEAPWYIARNRGGWTIISGLLMVAHFFLPFLVLLTNSALKRDARRLGGVAAFLVFMRLVDLFWHVAPTFRQSLWISPSDIGMPLLIGGVWLWLWSAQMRDKPIVPLYDPRFQEHAPHVLNPHEHEVVTHHG